MDLHDTAEPRVVLSVSELIDQLRAVMDEEFGEFFVEGEIGSLHRSRPGHLYFDLKDPDGQLRCALFRRSAERLRFEVDEGMLVRARARLDLYPERGTLQLIVEDLVPAGEGALRLAFERMKQSLHEEGLFDPAHKQPLPALPARIGLVTSSHGAALHDFLRGLRRRGATCDVLLYDARVQGETAWREVVRGLHLLDAQPTVEVIVLTRGGGSLEDLWTFNREEVVRAIFGLETPLVSAIGHEVDVVLADLVADARASTPTAAAELVVPDAATLAQTVDTLRRRLVARQRASLAHERQRLEGLRRGLVHPAQRLVEGARRLGDARERLQLAARRDLEDRRATLTALQGSLGAAVRRLGERGLGRLETLSARLDALSPLAVLGRGYALARRAADGVILRNASDAAVGSDIDVRLAKGALRATVSGQTEE